MEISHIRAVNFRNYKNLSVEFSPSGGILIGDNAQGKTNLLEIIHLSAIGKSHRTNKYKEMVKWDNEGFYIRIDGRKRTGIFSNELGFMPPRKKLKINGLEKRKLSDILGNVNVVMFAPEDLEIVKGGPQRRRVYLDKLICQIIPLYSFYLTSYYKLLKSKNIILRKIKQKKEYTEQLDILNSQLISYGTKIIHHRMDILDKFKAHCNHNHKRLTETLEDLILNYKPSIPEIEKDKVEESFRITLQRGYESELLRSISLYGPHKDDFSLEINGKEVSSFGSQGQQRTTVLSLKISELELLKSSTGEYPILLLDDVMSELDNKRRNFLINSIGNVQAFITSTGIEGLGGLKDKIDIFEIKNGNIFIKRRI